MSTPNETGRGGKFTPGPWKVHAVDGEVSIIGSEGEFVADCSDATKEHLANAKLIADSPRMYSALLNMMKLVDDLDHKEAVSSNFAAYEEAKAAIQLATE